MTASTATIALLSCCSFFGNFGAALTGFGEAIIFLFIWQIFDLFGYDGGDFKSAIFVQSLSLFSVQPFLLYETSVRKYAHRRLLLLFVPATLMFTPIGQYVGGIAPIPLMKLIAGAVVLLVAAIETHSRRRRIRAILCRKKTKTTNANSAAEILPSDNCIEPGGIEIELADATAAGGVAVSGSQRSEPSEYYESITFHIPMAITEPVTQGIRRASSVFMKDRATAGVLSPQVVAQLHDLDKEIDDQEKRADEEKELNSKNEEANEDTSTTNGIAGSTAAAITDDAAPNTNADTFVAATATAANPPQHSHHHQSTSHSSSSGHVEVQFGCNRVTSDTTMAGSLSGFLGGMIGIRTPPLMLYFMHPPSPLVFDNSCQRATGVVIMCTSTVFRQVFYLYGTFAPRSKDMPGYQEYYIGYQREDWKLYTCVIFFSLLGAYSGGIAFEYVRDAKETIRWIFLILLYMCGVSLFISAFT